MQRQQWLALACLALCTATVVSGRSFAEGISLKSGRSLQQTSVGRWKLPTLTALSADMGQRMLQDLSRNF